MNSPSRIVSRLPFSLRGMAVNMVRSRSTRQATQQKSALALTTTHSYSTMHDNDPELLEREKRRNLSNTQHKSSTPHDFAPGWNEYLATTSEASVKADRADGSILEFQRKTIERLKARHSPDERIESREADYSHDTVVGPLSGAQGREEDASLHEEVVTKKTVREGHENVHEKVEKR